MPFFRQTASDSCAHHPVRPRGHRGRAQKTQAVKHLALLALQSSSSQASVSFSASSSPVILSRLYCRSCSVSFPSPSAVHLPFIACFLVSSPYRIAFRLSSVSSVSSVFFCTPHTALATLCVYLLKHRKNSRKFERLFTELNLFGFFSSALRRTSMRISSLFREFDSGFVSDDDRRM